MGKILIIDNNEENYDHIRQFFNVLDHQVDYAANFLALESLVEVDSYDVLIVDYSIPDIDIKSLLPDLKRKMPECAIIVLCPNNIDVTHELDQASSYVFRLVQKPYYDAELYFQVKRAFENKRKAINQEEMSERGMAYYGKFIGQSAAVTEIFRKVERVSRTDVSVLLLGETGTGKDLIAQIIHEKSLRSEGPYVKVNCAALPEQLLESELFGYERGAFTGADRTRVGRFEYADGGTLFLDEVADLSLVTQAKLLRVLQQKEFERLGSNETKKTDVRILSATNKNLTSMIASGHFREDLFYRLNVITIRLPALREREGDVSLLLMYFLKLSNTKMKKKIKGFSPEAIQRLTNYRWPGNIREMENTLDRAVLLSDGPVIQINDLDLLFDQADGFAPIPADNEYIKLPPEGIKLKDAEYRLITQAMTRTSGNQKSAAKLLGISERVLSYKLKIHEIR